ncbi:hypothetical protein BpHYR1_028144 [Brachionus plicatilis]|uniref:Uncharacterized protein n=1 Tax=Brachionus plicatilis TaxID=10195 RepID=A0A3M7PN18_BRAPC|nr:hypothetical protein BpHYR1_028144 [Brachionus plicatilis]
MNHSLKTGLIFRVMQRWLLEKLSIMSSFITNNVVNKWNRSPKNQDLMNGLWYRNWCDCKEVPQPYDLTRLARVAVIFTATAIKEIEKKSFVGTDSIFILKLMHLNKTIGMAA